MNIGSILYELSQKFPDRPAIADTKTSERISYKYLEKKSSQIANMFKEAGLSEGDGILIFIPMSVSLYALLNAIFKMKMVAVFIDPYADMKYIESCCRNYPLKALVTSSRKAGLLGIFNKEIKKIKHKYILNNGMLFFKRFEEYENYSDIFEIENTDPETPALITFTSGSTGKPKTIVRTHKFLIEQHRVLEKVMIIPESSKVIVSLPIFLLSTLSSGLTSIIPEMDSKISDEENGRNLMNQIKDEGADTVISSPSTLEKIIKMSNINGERVRNIKRIFTGGAPVFPSNFENLRRVFPHSDTKIVYGSSEAEPMAELSLDEISSEDMEKMKNGAGLLAGKIINEIKLRILENNFETGEYNEKNNENMESSSDKYFLKKEKCGEIIVTGEHVLKSYLNKEENTGIKIDINNEIWHKTGDLGYIDEQDRLWLLGREKAEIKLENMSIYPFAVETALSFEKDIERTAITATDRKILLFAELKNKEDIIKEEIVNEVKKRLESRLENLGLSMVEILVIEHIPLDKRHNGKVNYTELENLAKKYK